jgi:hypothetical protein
MHPRQIRDLITASPALVTFAFLPSRASILRVQHDAAAETVIAMPLVGLGAGVVDEDKGHSAVTFSSLSARCIA